MNGTYGVAGGASGAVAVLAGAFGAHGLRDALAPRALEVYETAVRWQAVHALALLLTAVGLRLAGDAAARGARALRVAGAAFVAGTVLFSGSLYALALTGLSAFGAVTPVGGVAFVAGWVALALAARRLPPTGPR